MADLPPSLRDIDWSRTTWDGARLEQMRRYAALPLERIIAALEEMDELTRSLGGGRADGAPSESETGGRGGSAAGSAD
jgi:hypothetical protein